MGALVTRENLVIVGAVIVVTVIWLLLQLRQLRRKGRLRSAELAKLFAEGSIRGVPTGRTLVLSGRATSAALLTSPFGGTPCVAYRLRILGSSVDEVGIRVFDDGLHDETVASEVRLLTKDGAVRLRPDRSVTLLTARPHHRRIHEAGEMAALQVKLQGLGLSAQVIDGHDACEVWEDVVLPDETVRVRGTWRRLTTTTAGARGDENPFEAVVGELGGDLVLAAGPLDAIAVRPGVLPVGHPDLTKAAK